MTVEWCQPIINMNMNIHVRLVYLLDIVPFDIPLCEDRLCSLNSEIGKEEEG